MGHREQRHAIPRRELLKGALSLAGIYALARPRVAFARAGTSEESWWTMARGKLATPSGGVFAYLPVGLSEGSRLLGALARCLADEPLFEPGALPLRDTQLWIVGAEVVSLTTAEAKVVVELVPGPIYHFVALPTVSFYPHPIWDDGAKIVTMQTSTGQLYEQVVPATYDIEFPSLAMAFEFVEQGSGVRLGTVSYRLPDLVVEGTFPMPAGG
jgi:hypothetical protein